MADREVREVVEGEGYAVGAIDGIGEGYGFRKIRRELGVTEFGINAVVIPPGYQTGRHFHDRQQELYFVHEGRLEFEFEDGSRHVLRPGCAARVDPATVRRYKNVGDTDAVCVIVGAARGYVGRDGRALDDEESPRGPGFEGPPGAGPPLPNERS